MDDVQTDIAAIRSNIGTLEDVVGSIQTRNLDISYRIDALSSEIATINTVSHFNSFDTSEGRLNLKYAVMDILQELGIIDENGEYSPPSGIQISDEAFFKLVEDRV